MASQGCPQQKEGCPQRDKEVMKEQQVVKNSASKAKSSYKRKKPKKNNTREVWECVQTITDHNTKMGRNGEGERTK